MDNTNAPVMEEKTGAGQTAHISDKIDRTKYFGLIGVVLVPCHFLKLLAFCAGFCIFAILNL